MGILSEEGNQPFSLLERDTLAGIHATKFKIIFGKEAAWDFGGGVVLGKDNL